MSFFIMFPFLLSATIAHERCGVIVYQLGKTAGEIARFFARQVHIGAFADVRYQVVQFVDERICTLRRGRSSADNHHRPPQGDVAIRQTSVQAALTQVLFCFDKILIVAVYRTQTGENRVCVKRMDGKKHFRRPPVTHYVKRQPYHNTSSHGMPTPLRAQSA